MKQSFIKSAISDDSGQVSSTRILSFVITIFMIVYVSYCTYFAIEYPILSGDNISMILFSVFGAGAVKKPFENKKDKNHNEEHFHD